MLTSNLAAVQLQMQEHREVRELIESILDFARPGPEGGDPHLPERHERWLRELRHALALLHEAISVHFDHEEHTVFARSALALYGPHRGTAEALLAAHGSLLSEVAAVRRLADHGDQDDELLARLWAFCGHLRDHESAENHLVGAIYGIEVER